MACCHCLMACCHWPLAEQQRIGCGSPPTDDLWQPGMRVSAPLPHVPLLTCTLVFVPLCEY